jgi:transposase
VSLPGILEDPDNKLSGALRTLLAQLQLEMQYLGRQIDECDKLILQIANEIESCRRLIAIPGIGPLTATATIAAIGNGAAFKKGRGFAAWLGGGARRTLHRRQAEADRNQQARKQVSAKTLRTGSADSSAAEGEAICRPEYVAN